MICIPLLIFTKCFRHLFHSRLSGVSFVSAPCLQPKFGHELSETLKWKKKWQCKSILAELHARERSPLRKFGHLSIREKLVMTSAYDRTLTVQTLGEGEGSAVGPSGKEYVIAEVKFFAFQAPRSIRRWITWAPGLLKKKNESFFPQNFNVYINLDNRQRARARNK